MVRINDQVAIDDGDLGFEFSRSSGPGGQNVNKVETKVRLLFDVRASGSLTADQRDRIEERLATRITKDHVLYVTSQRHRTREANRRAAVERFTELLDEVLAEEEPRIASKVPKAQRNRRLQSKRRRSQKKALRTRPEDEE